MLKDKKAFIFYLVTTVVLWQFIISVRNICLKPVFAVNTADNPVFSLVYLKNTGAAFNILQGKEGFLIAFGIIALLAVVFYTLKFVEFKDKIKLLVSITLTAGILGNLTERISNGFIIDFIKLNFINFPVFNLFDVLITISIILCILHISFEEILKFLTKKAEDENSGG